MSLFQQKVLSLVKKIPRGKLTTYKLIAEKLNTKAYRQVGRALRNNKSPIIIPCHRVVNSDGGIGGYSRGVKKKIRLLKKEGIAVKKGRIANFSEVIFQFLIIY